MNPEDHDAVESPENRSGERAAKTDDPQQTLRVEVAADGMTARLYGSAPPEAQPAQIHQLFREQLKASGVSHGLDLSQVRNAMSRLVAGEALKGMIIANGDPPQAGEDARVTAEVEIVDSTGCRVDKHGKVIFPDAMGGTMVEPGDLLAVLHPSRPGKPGRNVLGKEVAAIHPRRRALQTGDGVELSESGLEVRAAIKGLAIRPAPDRFEVLGILNIKKDLVLKERNLDFPGLVRIEGAVTKGHKVRARCMQAESLEPGCEIDVERNLLVKGGAMGARIKLGGSLVARFVRDCQIVCQKDAVIESEIVNSTLRCGGGVRLTLEDSRIVNSTVAAIHGVSVGEVISTGANATMIRLGVRPEFEKKIHGLRQRVDNLLKERDVILEAVTAQKEELVHTEVELREMLAALKDPGRSADRDNLLSQVGMIRPMRETLLSGVKSGEARMADLEIKAGRVQDEIDLMARMTPKDTVWLDVRGIAEATTEVRGPHVSFTLDRPKRGFSMGEAMVKKPGVEGGAQPEMRLIPLRPPQEQAMVILARDLDT